MSDIPNPFKMLDLEREKKMKPLGNKCSSCDDETKEGFLHRRTYSNPNGVNKDIVIEGMEQKNEKWLFMGVLFILSIVFFISIIWKKFPIDIITNTSIQNIKTNPIQYFIVLSIFIGFAYVSLSLHTNHFGPDIEERFNNTNNKLGQPYVWLPILVGFLMFALRFIPGTGEVPALIGYFENTVGHFMFLLRSVLNKGLNKWIRSDNFEALTDNNADKVTNNFNPLMSLFNLNNYERIINNQLRFDNKTNQNGDTSDFFVTLEHEDGTKTNDDFINYIRNNVIMKRAFGELTLLILTTLISTGILHSVYR